MLSPILACADVEKSIAHYTQILGFQLAWQMPADESDNITFAAVKLGDAEIMLGITEGFVKQANMPNRGIGVQLYINLPENVSIEAIYNHCREKGANIIKELQTREWGEKAFNVTDPDGYQLMIAQQSKATT